jgi:hypothetical protein
LAIGERFDGNGEGHAGVLSGGQGRQTQFQLADVVMKSIENYDVKV